jgi:hypothetical protein
VGGFTYTALVWALCGLTVAVRRIDNAPKEHAEALPALRSARGIGGWLSQTSTPHRPVGLRALKRGFLHAAAPPVRQCRRSARLPAERLRALAEYADANVPFYRSAAASPKPRHPYLRRLRAHSDLTRADITNVSPARAGSCEDLLLLGSGHRARDLLQGRRASRQCQVVLARSQQWAGKGRWELPSSAASANRVACADRSSA